MGRRYRCDHEELYRYVDKAAALQAVLKLPAHAPTPRIKACRCRGFHLVAPSMGLL